MTPATAVPRAILHVDMDAFFAAVEEREDPSLRGKPVVIGSDPREGEGRGVVSTANYEARKHGVQSAMPISLAWRRCPHAVYLRPRIKLYAEASRDVFEVFARFTDAIEPLGIDEAFLDVTASRRLFGPGPEVARRLKEAVREATGLTASVGCASSKFVAKVASDLEKPDGLVVVPPGAEADFLALLPVRRLWGAGPKTLARLRGLGCLTIGDVAALDPEVLRRRFGDALGDRFNRLSRGVDARRVNTGRQRKSLGKETTFGRDVVNREKVDRTLLRLCEDVASACRRQDLAAATVSIKLRFRGFETVTRQRAVTNPVCTVEGIWPVARDLFRKADRTTVPIRLIGVTLSGFDSEAEPQLGMFDEPGAPVDQRVAEAVDRLRERFGKASVQRAVLLDDANRGSQRR
ncbi:MAG: DNA polymerase IV [Gemmatimonadota bacterium]